MWKYFAALLVLLAIGVANAQLPVEECTDCYANIITQTDTQIIDTVKIGVSDDGTETVAIGNQGLSAAVIVTPELVDETGNFMHVGFARIDQTMTQTVSNLGTTDPVNGEEGAKGITWNDAIQAAWIANQGIKEKELDADGAITWVKEGAYIAQTTNQTINNIYDYDSREDSKIMNADNKLAMIVDDLEAVINLTASADSDTTDSASSTGVIKSATENIVAGDDPAALP